MVERKTSTYSCRQYDRSTTHDPPPLLTKLLSFHGPVVDGGTQFGFLLTNIFTPLPCIAFFMITLQCLAYLSISAKAIGLHFLQIMAPNWSFWFVNILIISKKYLIMLGGVPYLKTLLSTAKS